jgi:hypothetical protein
VSLRLLSGILGQQGASLAGHAGVAAWVAANPTKVLTYYPMSDAAASGACSDASGNGNHATYGSGVSAGALGNGETVADMDGTANGYAFDTGTEAWLDSIAGVFWVMNSDITIAGGPAPVNRDASDRNWSIFLGDTSVAFLQITGGNPQALYAATWAALTDFTAGVSRVGAANFGMVDGVVGAMTTNTPTFETGSGTLEMGRKSPNGVPAQFFNGKLGSYVFLNNTHVQTDLADLHAAWTGTP